MKVKFCFNCGAELTGTGEFCAACGTKIEQNLVAAATEETGAETAAEMVAETPVPAGVASPAIDYKQPKKKTDSGNHTVAAVFLTLFLGLFAWIAGALYSFGTVVQEDNLLSFVQEVEWMDIEMETITNSENLYDTLGEAVFSYVDAVPYWEVSKDDFEEVVTEDFFVEYIVGLADRYLEAVKERNYKKGYLELEDVFAFFEENERDIDKILGDGFSEGFVYFFEKYASYFEDKVETFEEAANLKTYKKDWGLVLNITSFVLNNYITYLFAGLSLLFVILLVVVKRGRSTGYIGAASILAGGLFVATRVLMAGLVEKVERPLHLGVEILPVLFGSFHRMSTWIIISLFAFAIVSIIIRIMVGKFLLKKE